MRIIATYIYVPRCANAEEIRIAALRKLNRLCKKDEVRLGVDAPFKGDEHYIVDFSGKRRCLKRVANLSSLQIDAEEMKLVRS